MEPQGSTPKRKQAFSYYLMLSMILLVLCIVGFLTVNDYIYTRNNFENEAALLRVQSEQNIEESLRLTDEAWYILDDSLNERMKTCLSDVVNEYNFSGKDPLLMNFDTEREKLGDNFDFYIINESGVIIRTTYLPELGEDFRRVPYFYEYLTKIRSSQGFFPDRVVRDQFGAGKLRKFAYMPTPDHKYILEVGYAGKPLTDLDRRLDDQKSIERIVSVNPYIRRFQVFNTMGRRVDNNSIPGEMTQKYLGEVIGTRKSLDFPDPEHAVTTRYLFIDMKNDRYGSDPSRIVEITYDMGMINNALNNLIIFHILYAIAATIFGCILAFLLARRITRPIKEIARDVDQIAKGDLDHRIGTPESQEFVVLEQGINMMVDSLKGAFKTIKDGEAFQQEVIDQLPVAVFVKRVKDGRYIFWNRTSEQMFGHYATEVIGKTDRELFDPVRAETIEREDSEVLRNRSAIRNKFISNRLPGGRIIHMIILPVCDSTGTTQFILGISEDMTQANTNVTLDLLNSITRREILDQLSVILDHLERAQLMNTREDIQTFFNQTMNSVEAIKNQIAFVRMLQDLGVITPKWQEVGQSFQDAVSMLPAHTVRIASEVRKIEVFADSLLPRIFYTLLANSLKYAGPGLTMIRLSAEEQNGSLVVIYEDNGVGIPVADKERIFDFACGNNTGTGLFLMRELLSFTGITVRETGKPGRGVRFEILVPQGKFRRFP